MDIKDIKTLIKMVTETDISEFELESSEEKIRIKRGVGQEIVHFQAPPQFQVTQPFAPQPAAAPVAAASVAAPSAPDAEKGQKITSPIVGTFYRSSSPDAPSYVDVGDVVKKGQVLCIIEAMKLMNEIESEVDGKIVEILLENAQPVEYGEPLFRIEPVPQSS